MTWWDAVRRRFHGKTVSITITMPLDMLQAIEDLSYQSKASRSNTICYLVHMGIVYLQMLEEQEKLEEMEKEEKNKGI